jgi:hypothetical protein
MSKQRADYTEDEGELDTLGPVVPDFLPPPERLVRRRGGGDVQVTVTVSSQTYARVQREAARRHVPVERVIRSLVDDYAGQLD